MGSDAGQSADNSGEEQTENKLGICKYDEYNKATVDELCQYL
jgi:hypothetical protein